MRRSLIAVLCAALGAGACTEKIMLPSTRVPDAGELAVDGAVDAWTPPGGFGGRGGGEDARMPADGGKRPPDSFGPPSCLLGEYIPINAHRQYVVFSVDRTSSMFEGRGGPAQPTRYESVRKSLEPLRNDKGINIEVRWQEFPSRMECDGKKCCASSLSMSDGFDFDMGTRTMCADAGMNRGCADSPLYDALVGGVAWLSAQKESMGSQGSFTMVFFTDGEPVCGGSQCTDARSLAATARLNNIDVAVVALGDDAAKSTCLQQLATEPGLFLPAPDISQVDGQVRKLNDLLDARQCEFSSPSFLKGRSLTVSLAGEEVRSDPINGWDISDDGAFRLNGQACWKYLTRLKLPTVRACL